MLEIAGNKVIDIQGANFDTIFSISVGLIVEVLFLLSSINYAV